MPRVDHINLVPGKWLFLIGPANHRWLQFVHIPVDNPYIELPTGRLWRGVSQWHYNGLPLEFDCRPMRYAASRAEKESKGEDWIGSATDFALRHMRRRGEAKTKTER